jgi:hypothetical protein
MVNYSRTVQENVKEHCSRKSAGAHRQSITKVYSANTMSVDIYCNKGFFSL